MTYKDKKWNNSSSNNNNNNKRNATQAPTLSSPVCLFIYSFHISIPYLSQSHSSLHAEYSTHFPFLPLFLPVRGCLMDVIQWRILALWGSQNVRARWQKCHIFTAWKNLEWWASRAEFWGTPGQRSLKPIKPERVEFLIAVNITF
jgi:hypothetical protein